MAFKIVEFFFCLITDFTFLKGVNLNAPDAESQSFLKCLCC